MMIDERIKISFNKSITAKFLGEIWALAYYALKDAGRDRQLKDMKARIAGSKEPKETLTIIQDYVSINGRPKPSDKKKAVTARR